MKNLEKIRRVTFFCILHSAFCIPHSLGNELIIHGATPPSGWLHHREEFIHLQAARFPALHPRLPVVVHLDPDFVTAARERRSIEVVDDCGDALCGVATDELPEAWDLSDLRAMFTPAAAPRLERDAFAAALLGAYGGEDLDGWAAGELRGGVFQRWRDVSSEDDPLVFVPVAASLIRFLDPQHTMSFAAMRKRLENVDDRQWLRKLRSEKRAPRGERIQLPVRGATFSVVNRIERSILADSSRKEMERLRQVGYDAISLVPFAGQRGSGSTELRRFAGHPASETDLAMSLAAGRAHRLGMRVMLKPHVWSWPGGDATRIDPGSRWPTWFASYRRFLIHQALLARLIRADWLCIGTELTRSERRPEWNELIAMTRALFDGPITYAANFDAFEATPFWRQLDAVGVDAYFPLSRNPQATDAELRRGAAEAVGRMQRVARSVGKPVILTELGYPSTAAPWMEPWRERRDLPAAPRDQERAFAAILGALSESPSVLGFMIWKYESDPNLSDPTGYLPKGKPAESVIACHLGHKPCSQ